MKTVPKGNIIISFGLIEILKVLKHLEDIKHIIFQYFNTTASILFSFRFSHINIFVIKRRKTITNSLLCHLLTFIQIICYTLFSLFLKLSSYKHYNKDNYLYIYWVIVYVIVFRGAIHGCKVAAILKNEFLVKKKNQVDKSWN